ncbi:MAG: peptide chain release factor N(5)-glutamine methyltransferase [Actinomycetes bacterium]
MTTDAGADAPIDATALVRQGTGLLAKAGCETPGLDAELLVAHALGTDRAGLFRLAGEAVSEPKRRIAADLIERRTGREPVAQIIGRRWFRNIELVVSRDVLTPRPETELLVEWGLALPNGARVADIGTGSGAIALALADERPDLDIVATDLSQEALRIAAANAGRLGLDVALAAGDLLDAVDGPLDAVISNPPYVPDSDLVALAPEVTEWEPRIALTPGPSGLETIERLAGQASNRRIGRIALEVGSGQAPAVADLLRGLGWSEVSVLEDLAGIERVVAGDGFGTVAG